MSTVTDLIRSSLSIGAVALLAAGRVSAAHEPRLLTPQTLALGAQPDELTEFAGKLAFVATDADHGREVWISDGTPAGTAMVADLDPGTGSSNPRRLFAFQDALLFFATDAGGTMKLWSLRSDGIAHELAAVSTQQPWARDRPIVSIPGPRCPADAPVVFRGQLYFAADDGQNGLEL